MGCTSVRAMSHKPFSGLEFKNSVPKFLQNAIAEHGVKTNSFLAKKFVSEDGEIDNDETEQSAMNSSDPKHETLENGERKDTEFEKPVILNIEEINDLDTKQREQLNDIIRDSQMEQIKHSKIGNENEEDQNVIGMEKRRKPKFKFTKNKKRNIQNNKNTTNS